MNVSNTLTLVIELSVGLSLLMMLALLATLLIVRSRSALYFHHRNVLTKQWREVFKTAYTGEPLPAQLPLIAKNDLFTVLCLYEQFHDIRAKDLSRSGEVTPKLDELAKRTGLDDYALSLLQRGDDAEKILALTCLGQMRDPRALETAKELTVDPGTELSRAAAQCALRLDQHFLEEVLQLILVREDWARSRVEMMLRDVDPDALGRAMRAAIASAPNATKPRLLDFVRFCPPSVAHEICTQVLAESSDPEVLASALRSLAPLANDSDHATALRYASHASDIVTLSALRVLRKCVHEGDRDLLARLASNSDYWVRLRAAEAAVQLLETPERIEHFATEIGDRYARDALRQAVAEKAMAARRADRHDRRIAPQKETAA